MIHNHTDLKVGNYVGEMRVDSWDKNVWEKEFNENSVLVMTAQIFLNLLLRGFIKLSQVNLLIFDECHHAKSAKKSHPYKQIMEFFRYYEKTDHPKIMGLTACVINKKLKQSNIESEIRELECTLRSTCETSQDEEVEKFAAKPNEKVIKFSNASSIEDRTNELVQILQDILNPGREFLCEFLISKEDHDSSLQKALKFAKRALRECQETLKELGPWAANKVAGCLIKDLAGIWSSVCN